MMLMHGCVGSVLMKHSAVLRLGMAASAGECVGFGAIVRMVLAMGLERRRAASDQPARLRTVVRMAGSRMGLEAKSAGALLRSTKEMKQ